MSRGQAPAPKHTPQPARASRRSQGIIGRPHRVPLPSCRQCDGQLTRKAKNAGHIICAACSAQITDSSVTFTLAKRVKA
jgi:hypothetical protein